MSCIPCGCKSKLSPNQSHSQLVSVFNISLFPLVFVQSNVYPISFTLLCTRPGIAKKLHNEHIMPRYASMLKWPMKSNLTLQFPAKDHEMSMT